jgi:SAM-dependent methyltransferase
MGEAGMLPARCDSAGTLDMAGDASLCGPEHSIRTAFVPGTRRRLRRVATAVRFRGMGADAESLDLSSMDPTGRFSDRADDYIRYRPDYPAAAIDAILEGLGDPAALMAADIGAGTGISARQLADRGVHVIAVEPNAPMRSAAAPHPRVEWRDGTAEATGLDDAGVGLVLAAQAFHWFRPREAIAEFRRVSRPGGRLALIWNVRDNRDDATRGYTEAIRTVARIHPAERPELEPGVVDAAGLFTRPRRLTFEHAQRLDRAGLFGRAASSSYVPKQPAALEELERRLAGLHARLADPEGLVTLRYLADVFLAQAR